MHDLAGTSCRDGLRRYEGLDQRVIDHAGLMEVSIGDVVLSGEGFGTDDNRCCCQLLPGVMGNAEFMHRTVSRTVCWNIRFIQPREWQGMAVPDVLLSGNHEPRQWRQEASKRRPANAGLICKQAWQKARKKTLKRD